MWRWMFLKRVVLPIRKSDRTARFFLYPVVVILLPVSLVTMKGCGIIILILGLCVLIGYWGITSDRMARSIREGQVSVKPSPGAEIQEIACAGSGKPRDLNATAADKPAGSQ